MPSKKRGLGSHSPIAAAIGRSARKATPPQRTTFSLSREVAGRVRDAAAWERVSVVEYVEQALLAAVEAGEREHGESFTYPPSRRR